MMHKILGMLTLALFIACAADNPNSTGNADFDANPSEETYAKLINEQMGLLRNPDADPAARAEALQMGYKASIQMEKKPQAIGFLNTYIRENFQAEDTPDKIIALSGLLKSTGKESVAETLAQGFELSFPNHPRLSEAKAMISADAKTIDTKITELGNTMFDVEKGKLNEDVARQFVDQCEAYAISAPQQEDVADYLHKAAETARTMRTLPKAMSLYDWILEDYPNHAKAPQALFLKAFTYDNSLNDVDNARKFYTAFLEKYPEDDFADDTKFLLENLGKTDEEMLEALTKKAKK